MDLTLISISSGYLPNYPYTIQLGVDTFRRNKSLQNLVEQELPTR
jgi:hypothetical protein